MVVFSNTCGGAIARMTVLDARMMEETGFSTDIPRPHLSYFREKTWLMRPLFEKIGFPIVLQNREFHR